MKKEHLITINPNTISTRVCLDNKTLVHKDKKKQKSKYKCRKGVDKNSEM